MAPLAKKRFEDDFRRQVAIPSNGREIPNCTKQGTSALFD